MRRKIYLTLTRSFNLTVLHILFSLASGVLINLITGTGFTILVIIAIGLNVFALIALGILINTRTKIDWHFAARDDEHITEDIRWANAADFGEKKRVRWFFASVVVFTVFFLAGLSLTFVAGFRQGDPGEALTLELKERQSLQDKLESLRNDSIEQAKEIDYFRGLLKVSPAKPSPDTLNKGD
jgi:hypothetical protein